ncbi:ABC transporter ATP-binding protein|uniref:NitT/TauT family transport system ATP-binding protein n=1 Tax=Dendrosporobacter quercicolus TaxID=146817 RepID=A0A1G9RVH2_9FIRM|nr:ABC transporter ATP-binding protein [Dendrosporobacter quercicolus]NSL49330.1 ABC transporter ATP-binding protein [Dendrosporobacter quercicolus DSM 1736]SDM27259.1 NitT/TauT family transport system ATP-binding protein [Dendrosporobacter quercicolus]
MSTAYKLQIEDVSMVYRGQGGEDITALKNVNLNIRKSEFISLLGPSGCGKTTLLRLIADLLQPTSGKIAIGGLSPRAARKARQYGMVFQSPVLYEWRTIRENICLPLEIMNKTREERKNISDEMLEMVGLSKFAECYPFQLSGGMQQRVGIARALAINPEILLMDEPFSALDEFTRNKLQEDLLRIWSNTKKTVIFVTHNISEAIFLSDRVCVLTPHPGILSAVIDIDLPRPRVDDIRDTPEFAALLSKIRKCFAGMNE